MLFLAERGYRCIAHDRRGHGRSSQPWGGNDMHSHPGEEIVYVVEGSLEYEVEGRPHNRLDKGGHFAAWEQPELFAAEMRAALRSLR